MTRFLLLLFTLNTLLFPVGAAAMMPFGASDVMAQENNIVVMNVSTNEDLNASHCANMPSHHLCNIEGMSSELCKAKCATACSVFPLYITDFSFIFPINISHANLKIDVTSFYNNRSISPELRPPLV